MTNKRNMSKVTSVVAILHIVVGVTGNDEKENAFLNLITSSQYYVDETEFLKVFNGEKSPIYFTAPPSFGKTINLSMLKAFYGMNVNKNGSIIRYSDSESHKAFTSLKKRKKVGPTIFDAKVFTRTNFASLPVIHLSFKDLDVETYDSFMKSFSAMCAQAYKEHRYLINSKKLHSVDKVTLSHYASTTKSKKEVFLIFAGEQLSSFLYRHFGQRSVVLIDDFDTPVLKMLTGDSSREKEILVVLREFVSALIKDNDYVQHAFLTGNTKLAKFYCPDNVVHYQHSKNENWSQFFGFTDKEIEFLVDCAQSSKEILQFYCGYVIGPSNHRVCNPYSVTQFLKHGKKEVFWPRSEFMTREYKQFLDLVVHLDSARGTIDRAKASDEILFSPFDDLDFDDIMRLKALLSPKSALSLIPVVGGYTVDDILLELGYFTLKDRTDIHGRLAVPNEEIGLIFDDFLAESWRLKFNTSEEACEAVAVAAILLEDDKSRYEAFADIVANIYANASSLPQNQIDLASPIASFLIYYGKYYASLDVKRDNVTRSNIVALQKTKDSKNSNATALIIGSKYSNCNIDPLLHILCNEHSKVLHPWDKSCVVTKFFLVGVCFEKKTEKSAQMRFSFLYNSADIKEVHRVDRKINLSK